MQLPIPIGTILQNRYRLISILGQGGFSRTYLAEDTGRFNELCAIKEFIPQQTNANVVAKSQELFAREAAILYQIEHPQIPKFRATFEENQRLFLLQDYVVGKTYRTILQERQQTSNLFSEAEVLTFLAQILPVLAHIHNFGIVHRDISPDNIIRRETDQMPVLIDFGVVKEIATKVQSPDLTVEMTNVGKVGYAPWEQIQLGRATASSDLYALAVTIVVLLTGKDPQVLIDQTTLKWDWQRWVAVSPELAEIINKMLSHQPGDRYQSVTELEKDLATLPSVKSQQPPTINQAANNSSLSQVGTVVVGSNQNFNTDNDSLFDHHKWSAVALIVILVLLSGVVSWGTVNLLLKRKQQPEVEEVTEINPSPVPNLPTITSSPSSSPSFPSPSFPSPSFPSPLSPSPTAQSSRSPTLPPESIIPVPSPTPETITETPSVVETPPKLETSEERLDLLLPGEPISIEGNLKGNETVSYIISGSQGQKLSLLVTGEGVLMSLLRADGEGMDGISEKVSNWKGILPIDGDYKIILSPLPGLSGTDYKLDIDLTNPIPQFTPTTEPKPTNSPTPTTEPKPTNSPTPTTEPKPTNSPTPTTEPKPTNSPTPTTEPKPTNSPTPTTEPKPTNSPTPTTEPKPTNSPTPTTEPKPTNSPTPTTEPKPTNSPTPTTEPEPTNSPTPTTEPEPTDSPTPAPFNKPSKKSVVKPFPTSTLSEQINKPAKE
ncbi:serine/threonine-protein kinase [Okeania sp.]|uniref:serine/threonine-protein kinase n=1 Tax=Okeania sp. TaxID=3100323 RepID=UPI002B4B0C39|nr:serine/threonine-protein kinase [Okeania sp.]MEB3339547.1 serine/threonine-protein kinase [Okeania sp.]